GGLRSMKPRVDNKHETQTPFKIGDIIDAAGESEVIVTDIGTLFTIAKRKDGNTVLIPSTALIGQKIVIRKQAET
ncbi:MAG: hypothetical protein QW417_04530, partial [Zestosphaera sp.]